MNLPADQYNIIMEEFKQVQKFTRDAKTAEDVLYFFSASYAVLNRVMNLHCEPILVFMHQVLYSTHQLFNQRLTAPKRSGLSGSFPDELFDLLLKYFNELVEVFETKNEDEIRKVLEKLSFVTYATSGNGFYLYLSKKLVP